MLGRQGDPHGKFDLPPGVMEHFETATRDPAFFRLHKYMDNIFREHKDSLTPYTKEELEFSGVSVNSITIKSKLTTFFENYTYSLVNAVNDSPYAGDVPINTVIPRLAHNEFQTEYKIDNNNEREVTATMRVFMWPKYDNNKVEFSFNEGRWHAIEIDKFWVKLSPGQNSFTRSSKDSAITVPDVPSFQMLINKTKEAMISGSELRLDEYHSSLGIPNRFLLPKGTTEGMDFQFVVFVSDGSKDMAVEGLLENTSFNHYGCHDGKYPDKMPHGYPLDRRVDDERIITGVSNFKTMVVKVFHTDASR
ncbi:Hemocyanin C chain [Portunus trituberculatus]|uniref:Hemocyanin C chain n=1 Tax=Portunus trituberculatus TaxID=210409 RepID=A0A5B7HN03_PORTR|nr:Hemocyanin C chain [Portunus trituberculatus]